MTDTTVTTEAPTPPQMEPGPSRTPDGTIQDQGTTTPSPPTGSTEAEGGSFLTGKAKEPEVAPAPVEGEKKPDTPAGAPEAYADFKLPEGYTLDPTAAKEVTSLFKNMNLSQDQAQQLVDYYAKNSMQAAEAPYKAWADLQKEWVSDINDRFGSKAEAVRTDISRAIDSALPPSLARSFRQALDLTGAGSNPDIVEALHIMLRGHAEGSSVRGNGPTEVKPPGAPDRPSPAQAIYGHLAPNRIP